MKTAALALALLAAGCGEEAEPTAIVDLPSWEAATAAEDPWAADRPADPACEDVGVLLEGEELEFDTGACGWFTVKWQALTEVRRNDDVHVLVFHAPLAAEEPAEAHAELRFGDSTVWQRTVPIPQDAKVYDVTEPVVEGIEEGGTVWFHLDNHGSNTWRLATLELAVE